MEAGASEFEAHPGRGRFNAAFFHVMDGYIDWHLRRHKEAVYADLPRTVVEIGSGVGAKPLVPFNTHITGSAVV